MYKTDIRHSAARTSRLIDTLDRALNIGYQWEQESFHSVGLPCPGFPPEWSDRIRDLRISPEGRVCQLLKFAEQNPYAPSSLRNWVRRFRCQTLELRATFVIQLLNRHQKHEAWHYYWDASILLPKTAANRLPRPQWPIGRLLNSQVTLGHELALNPNMNLSFLNSWLGEARASDRPEIIDFRETKFGYAPLLYSLALSSSFFLLPAVVDLLLKSGADPNLTDFQGNTPLHWAARNPSEHHQRCVRSLVAHGANPLLRNLSGFSPSDWANRWRSSESEAYLHSYQSSCLTNASLQSINPANNATKTNLRL